MSIFKIRYEGLVNIPDERKVRYLYFWWFFWIGFVVLTYMARAVIDPDFFWHLKTGEWLWQYKSLPYSDPFPLLGSPAVNPEMNFLLRAYWLAQLLFYGFYSLLGVWGIMLLRVVMAGLLVFLVAKRCQANPWVSSCLLVVFVITTFIAFPIERPQFFSFIGMAAMLLVLDKMRVEADKKSRLKLAVALSIIMIVWGNMHPGILAGQAVLLTYCACELFKVLLKLPESQSQDQLRYFLLAAGVGLVCSTFNPDGPFKMFAYLELARSKGYFDFVSEYRSFWSLLKMGDYSRTPMLLFVLGAIIAFIRSYRKIDLTYLAMTICFAFAAFTQLRYVPFFMVCAVPVAARGFTFTRFNGLIVTFIAVVVLAQTYLYSGMESFNLTALYVKGPIRESPHTPVAGADWVEKMDLQGNMLNDYNFGGYLTYRFAPDRQLFVDGRFLWEKRLRENFSLSGAAVVDNYPREEIFEDIVDKYDIGFVFIRKYGDGGIFWLAEHLSRHPEWEISFFNKYSVIFVKKQN